MNPTPYDESCRKLTSYIKVYLYTCHECSNKCFSWKCLFKVIKGQSIAEFYFKQFTKLNDEIRELF